MERNGDDVTGASPWHRVREESTGTWEKPRLQHGGKRETRMLVCVFLLIVYFKFRTSKYVPHITNDHPPWNKLGRSSDKYRI